MCGCSLSAGAARGEREDCNEILPTESCVPLWALQHPWPILLIVIGAIKVARYVMPDDSHRNPGQYGPSYVGQAAPPGAYPPPPCQQAMPQAGVAQNDAQNVAQNEAPESASVVTPSPLTEAADGGSVGNSEAHNG